MTTEQQIRSLRQSLSLVVVLGVIANVITAGIGVVAYMVAYDSGVGAVEASRRLDALSSKASPLSTLEATTIRADRIEINGDVLFPAVVISKDDRSGAGSVECFSRGGRTTAKIGER